MWSWVISTSKQPSASLHLAQPYHFSQLVRIVETGNYPSIGWPHRYRLASGLYCLIRF